MVKEFKVASRRKEAIPFTIEGDDYQYSFTPPKKASLVVPMLAEDFTEGDSMRSLFDWLGKGLGEEGKNHLIARLEDPEDDLDVEIVGELAQDLAGDIGGRPTT